MMEHLLAGHFPSSYVPSPQSYNGPGVLEVPSIVAIYARHFPFVEFYSLDRATLYGRWLLVIHTANVVVLQHW